MSLKVPAGVSGQPHPSPGRKHEVIRTPFARALSRVEGSGYFKLLPTKAGFLGDKKILAFCCPLPSVVQIQDFISSVCKLPCKRGKLDVGVCLWNSVFLVGVVKSLGKPGGDSGVR